MEGSSSAIISDDISMSRLGIPKSGMSAEERAFGPNKAGFPVTGPQRIDFSIDLLLSAVVLVLSSGIMLTLGAYSVIQVRHVVRHNGDGAKWRIPVVISSLVGMVVVYKLCLWFCRERLQRSLGNSRYRGLVGRESFEMMDHTETARNL
ncbi:LAMI_0F12442g1_1 [Lachancea mirantina]|uniref:LAMI_0F12442g1_1 n=1 Tax=Lachancea mirantina TaxID=1230905 RepID=A0A1G4K2W2_9SACH|nr:LAMI_0F12442g1_1 [Lachancea mirantina]